MKRLQLIVHDVRSAHNVGAMLRTADCLGLDRVYMSGYTPYPVQQNDSRLPHVAAAATRMIAKTALGAEESVDWLAINDAKSTIKRLAAEGWLVCGLEQTEAANDITRFKTKDAKIVLVVGNEVGGLPRDILALCRQHLEIPMAGTKESLNVSIAAAIALYHLKYMS